MEADISEPGTQLGIALPLRGGEAGQVVEARASAGGPRGAGSADDRGRSWAILSSGYQLVDLGPEFRFVNAKLGDHAAEQIIDRLRPEPPSRCSSARDLSVPVRACRKTTFRERP